MNSPLRHTYRIYQYHLECFVDIAAGLDSTLGVPSNYSSLVLSNGPNYQKGDVLPYRFL